MTDLAVGPNRPRPTANGRPPTANGQWPTVIGHRSTANGQRPTVDGQRSTANGQRPTVDGQPSTANGRRATVDGRRSTANGQRERGAPGSETILRMPALEIEPGHDAGLERQRTDVARLAWQRGLRRHDWRE